MLSDSVHAVKDEPEDVSERIRRAMESRGIGYRELDRAIGKRAGAYMSNLITKRQEPSARLLFKIADALGVPADWLVAERRGDSVPMRPGEAWPAVPAPATELASGYGVPPEGMSELAGMTAKQLASRRVPGDVSGSSSQRESERDGGVRDHASDSVGSARGTGQRRPRGKRRT